MSTFIVENLYDLNKRIELYRQGYSLYEIIAVFQKSFIIDSQVNLLNLTKNGSEKIILSFSNVKGFNVRKAAFLVNISLMNPNLYFFFESGNLDMYDDKGSLIGPSCDDYLKAFHGLNDLDYQDTNKSQLVSKTSGIFSSTYHTFNVNQEVGYSNQICPLAFKGANIYMLQILLLERNLLFNRLLAFSDLDDNGANNLDCTIIKLHIVFAYKIMIGSGLINKDIFRSVYFIYVSGVILAIDQGVLRSLSNLHHFNIQTYNLRAFFHENDNKWFADINHQNIYESGFWRNANETVREEQYDKFFYLVLNDLSIEYEFPDEDFCLFTRLDPDRLISVLIRLYLGFKKNPDKLSCTMFYIIQYAYVYRLHKKNYEYFGLYIFEPDELMIPIERCNITSRLDVCKNSTISRKHISVSLNIYDFMYAVEWLTLIGPVITFPIVSFVGFICNLVIALVIKNRANHKEFFKDDRLYQLMLINSIFNMIECFNSVLNLMSECLGSGSIYCSSIMYYLFTQYFTIYVVQYLGECMKTCSILTVLAISYERYSQTSNSASWFNRLSSKRFLAFVIVIGFLTSINKIFEYGTALNVDYDSDGNTNSEYPILFILFLRRKLYFIIIYTFHYIFNDLFLLSLNFYIDFRLLLVVKKDLKLKRQNLLNMNSSDNATSSKKLQKINEAEKNTNKMVIYSFIVYLFCRFPELIVYLHMLFIDQDFWRGYDYYSRCLLILCTLYVNIIQYMYMFSYIVNLFFFYKFNRKFRDGFKAYFKLKGSHDST